MKKNVFIIILIVLITGIISAGLTYYFLDKKKDAEKEKEKEELREEYESRMEEREDGEL